MSDDAEVLLIEKNGIIRTLAAQNAALARKNRQLLSDLAISDRLIAELAKCELRNRDYAFI